MTSRFLCEGTTLLTLLPVLFSQLGCWLFFACRPLLSHLFPIFRTFSPLCHRHSLVFNRCIALVIALPIDY
ncbi:hypothetical protein [Pectobacterium aroidearum]|uniref:hypothetical protein n=1 Tax=Pectobacterium aroidearum TaxID=1201031 RepID=UPI0032EF2D6C